MLVFDLAHPYTQEFNLATANFIGSPQRWTFENCVYIFVDYLCRNIVVYNLKWSVWGRQKPKLLLTYKALICILYNAKKKKRLTLDFDSKFISLLCLVVYDLVSASRFFHSLSRIFSGVKNMVSRFQLIVWLLLKSMVCRFFAHSTIYFSYTEEYWVIPMNLWKISEVNRNGWPVT